jgi:phosphoglycerol transferase
MSKFKIAGLLWVLALLALVTVAWCGDRDRMSAETWGVPLDYQGDGPQILGWFKAASEGDYIPFWTETARRLNAPYQANWKDFPMYEKFTIFLLGVVAKCIGVYQAGNFSMLLAHLLSALSFYFCCRFLKHARIWSFVGAVLFSFTYYHFLRNLGHVLLAYSYPLPWAILSCWIIVASKRIRPGDRLSWVCFITALVMGVSNPYNLNLYLQLLCFAVLAQFLRKRRPENLRVGILSLLLAGGAFLAVNLGTFAYHWAHGQNPVALDRNYFESELYALKPMEFFIPPVVHNIQGLADIGAYYISLAYVHGEMTSPYLGIVAIVGLLWIFWESFWLIVKLPRRTRPFPPYALQTTWIIFYSVIGGVNCLLALAGLKLFRSTDRYSIFVSTIVLLFLVSRLSVRSRRWSPGLNLGLAAGILLVGMYDEVPRPLSPAETMATERIVASDISFGRKMEEKLPAGSMVFELPVMSFPEGTPVHNASGYEMLRPYLVTKTLRFSFGAIHGRNREAWQWEVEKMPAPQMISALEKYGFSAVFINRKGCADQGGDLLKQFAAEGRSEIIEDDAHEQVCVLLHPSATPELPHTDDRADFLYRRGWAMKDRTPLENRAWSSGDAALTFFSEPAQPASYSFRCVIGSIADRRVSIVMRGRELWSSEIAAGQGVPVYILVDARHGNNTLEFKTDAPAVHTKDSPLPLAFTVINLQITKTSP